MKELELRNRIAADLHDEVGSSLSSIHMLSQIASEQGNVNTRQTEILSRMRDNARETMEKMSDIVWMIKPGESEAGSLKKRIERFAYEAGDSQNIEINTDIDAIETGNLSMDQRKNIYLIFKEALNNALKYSGTDKIDIRVSTSDQKFRLTVRDYGKGFDTAASNHGNGLGNMKVRANELHGVLNIHSTPGEGTTIELSAPL
jgi:signal transduction histidine kinase